MLALVANAGAMIATSSLQGGPYEPETFRWQVTAAASRRITWGERGGDAAESDIQVSTVRVELTSPPGRYRVGLSLTSGRAVDGRCKEADGNGDGLDANLMFAQMSSDLWGDYEGRFLGIWPTVSSGWLEFLCTEERCEGAVELPAQVHHVDARVNGRTDVCVLAVVEGPAKEREVLDPPRGLALTVKLEPFRVLVADADGGELDAGGLDASVSEAGASEADASESDDAGLQTDDASDGGADDPSNDGGANDR